MFCMLIMLMSCQSTESNNEKATDKSDNDAQIKNDDEEEEDELYSYSLDPYEIEIEPEGELFAEYIGDTETAEDDEYEPAEEKAIDALVEKVKELDQEEMDESEKVA